MGSSMALSGLVSGIDTSSIISQLMAVERAPEAKLQTKQYVEQARHDRLAQIKTQLSSLSDAAAALRAPGLWVDTQSVESSDAGRVAAVRTGGAGPGGY